MDSRRKEDTVMEEVFGGISDLFGYAKEFFDQLLAAIKSILGIFKKTTEEQTEE